MKVFAAVAASYLLVAGCSKNVGSVAEKHVQGPAAEHEDEPAHEGLPSKVRLPELVIAEAKISTAVAAREALAMTLSLPGELLADPDKSARVSSPVPGRIERVEFKEGSTVKKGDVLATIRLPELAKLRAESAGVAVRGKAARANAERLKALAAQRFAAEQDVVTAEAEASALEKEAEGLEEQLLAFGAGRTSSTLSLRAPVAGVVLSRDATIGQPVTADHTLANIADLSELWFLGRVFEKDLGRLHVGAAAEVMLNAYANERFHGTVEYLGKQIDPGSRTVTARIRLYNRNELLRVGLFGTARVATEEHDAPVLAVPSDAVTEVGDQSVVFVRQPDGDFELHPVTLGSRGPDRVEVLTGVREGEQVVVTGVFALKSAFLKSTFTEEE